MHLLLVTIILKWLYDMWSGSGVDKLLHCLIVLINSTLAKDSHSDKDLNRTSSSKCKLIYWSWAELKVW